MPTTIICRECRESRHRMCEGGNCACPGHTRELTRDQAMAEFRALTSRHGLRWTADVPRHAWDRLAEVDRVLDEKDRREALGLPK